MADNKTPIPTGSKLMNAAKRFKALSFSEYVALPHRQQCFVMSDQDVLYLVSRCTAETDGSFTLELLLNQNSKESVRVGSDTTILQVIG